MNRFLKMTLAFVLPLLVVIAAGEVLLRRAPNDYALKRDMMAQHHDRVATLILGSSHNHNGLVPAVLGDSVYSLAQGGQHVEYSLFLLKKYAPQCPLLRTVIINLDCYNFLNRENEDTYYYFVTSEYTVHYGYDKHRFPSRYYLFSMHPRYFISQLARIAKRTATGESLLESDSRGWLTDTVRTAGYLNRNLPEHLPLDSAVIAANHRRMIEMMTYCRSRGIRLIAVTTPKWVTYRDALDPAMVQAMRDEIVALRSLGLEYRDYFADPRFTADDFIDSHHLYALTGAPKFTRIVMEDFGLAAGE